jgi:hypothetical protein
MGVDKLYWAACILLGALLLIELTKFADAHVPGHEEWNDVLSASKNQYNGQCCGLGDAQLVELMTGGGRLMGTTKSTFSDSGGLSSRGRSLLTK